MEPMANQTQGEGGGGTLVVRNNLGVSVVVQGLHDERERDDKSKWGFFGGGHEGAEFTRATQSSNYGSRSSDETPGNMAADSGYFSRPKMLPVGQTVECQLPARREWGNGVAVELIVFVPGFQAVAGIRIGSRGTYSYPLIESVQTSKGAAVSGFALVVDVHEKKSTSAGSSDDRMSYPARDSTTAGGWLVAELRTNVRVQNSSASEIEVDMMEAAAAAAAAATPGSVKSVSSGSGAFVRLAAGAQLALPLPVLASSKLRIIGDATNTQSRPLKLSPALLDPNVPNALRLTSNMERNSVCLRLAKSNIWAPGGAMTAVPMPPKSPTNAFAASKTARGKSSKTNSKPASSLKEDGNRRKSLGVRFQAQQQAADSSRASIYSQDGQNIAETAGLGSKGDVLRSKPSLPMIPPSGVLPSPTADWVLIVQASYLITNALPCAMEVEVFQPSLAVTASLATSGGNRVRNASSSSSSLPADLEETDAPEQWRENNSDSDAESVTSSVISRKGGGRSRIADHIKAAVRNPALDLFFLPTPSSLEFEDTGSSGVSAGGGRTGMLGSSGRRRGRGGGDKGGVGENIAEGSRGSPTTDARSTQRASWMDSGHEGQDVTHGLESIWKGMIGSGREAKVNLKSRISQPICM